MEPVQRIPRYTLLFRQMIKQMPIHDPQRAKLLEADNLASKIASAEVDEQTKRAAIMYCLKSTIEDFPPALVSNSRRFVDCIDVEDIILPSQDSGPGTPGGSGSGSVLHCSLLLFDDKLVIVKRPGNGERSARALTGLDDLDKVTKLKALHSGKVKTGMVCKGVVEVTDVMVADVGGTGTLFLQNYQKEGVEVRAMISLTTPCEQTFISTWIPRQQIRQTVGPADLFVDSRLYFHHPPMSTLDG